MGSTTETLPQVVLLHRLKEFRKDHLNHTIPLGQVVDVTMTGNHHFGLHQYNPPRADKKEISLNIKGKARLIVVGHTRDCDGEPLYCLSDRAIGLPEDPARGSILRTMQYKMHCNLLLLNYGKSSLKVVKGQVVPLKYANITEYLETEWYPTFGRP